MFGSHTRPSYDVIAKTPDSEFWDIIIWTHTLDPAERGFNYAMKHQPPGTAVVLRRFSRHIDGLSKYLRRGIAGKPETIENDPGTIS